MKTKQVYSVYDYRRQGYDYYEGPLVDLPASGRFRQPRIISGVVLPESLAVKVPAGAKLVGHGDNPKGLIASPLGADAGGDGSGFYWGAAVLGLALVAWRLNR